MQLRHSLVISGLLLLIACSRKSDAEKAGTPPTAIEVAVCGAVVEAPSSFTVAGTLGKFDRKVLSRSDGTTIAISCVRKRNSGPLTLRGELQWIVDSRLDARPVEVHEVDPSDLQRRIAHHTVLADLVPKDGERGALAVIENATAFYWIEYTTPTATWNSHADERDQVFGSFRITDSAADQGPTRWWHAKIVKESRTLLDARAGFQTAARGGRPTTGDFTGHAAPTPPAGVFNLIEVGGQQGRLAAYVTPDPKDGKKHPAVIWAHGGFGEIGSEFWDSAPRSNDQSARAFREAGIVLAVGSWRAENDNPGDYQLYYGEVDDFLALRDQVRKLPYVDPDRIYLAGHSSGGTLVLLAAELSDGFRAAFSIGGDPMQTDFEGYERFGGVPFDPQNKDEGLLRSAAPFVSSVRRPTFYFEGSGHGAVGAAQWMADEAAKMGVPFKSFIALEANHFTILAPITELIAKKILADTGPTSNISFTQDEVEALKFEH